MSLQAAPLFDDVAQGPPGGAAHWVTTSDDLRIRVGYWAPEHAKGTVLLFPGRTEYIEKYGPAAKDLFNRGYATIVIDWRGQGLSDRLLEDARIGHVDAFTDYQKDLCAMKRAILTLDLPQPYYLLAHSMGGAIGLRALMEGLNVQAAVFSAPMWGIKMASVTRPAAWALSWSGRLIGQGHRLPPSANPDAYVLTAPFENNLLTNDREMYEFMVHQVKEHPELVLGGPSLTWVQEALRETLHLANRMSPGLPCLTWCGSDERIVDPVRIHSRMNCWPNGKLVVIDGHEHEVLMGNPALRERLFDQADAFFSNYQIQTAPLRSA